MRSRKTFTRLVTCAVGLGVGSFALHSGARAASEGPPAAGAPAQSAPAANTPAANTPAPPPVTAIQEAPLDYYGGAPGYSAVGGYGYPPVVEDSVGFHAHDGFFLRVQLGGGFSGLSSTSNGVKTTVGGGGGAFGLAIGGTIARNLILYGIFFDNEASNPDVQVGGTSVASPIGDTDWQGLGGGLTYYFAPIDLYVGAALAMTHFWMHDQNGNQLDSSKAGLGLDLEVGKEWWVSRDWGLGVALRLTGSSMKDQNDPTLTWSAAAGSLMFSATYN